MNPSTVLPSHADHELRTLAPPDLIALLIRDEDRAPRNLIDECARRGADMVDALAAELTDEEFWDRDVASGEWWLRLHAVMILGLIPEERAGLLLVVAMRLMDLAMDEDLQDWCAGNWPAFFRNKPDSVIPGLREICTDRELDWYIRANAVDPVMAAAQRQGDMALNEALAWVAGLVADEAEDWDFRLCAAGALLDFPRVDHRPLLEALASRQGWPHRQFDVEEIEEAFAAGRDEPGWERFDDPWAFYAPQSIAGRQRRWAEEDRKEREREAARLARMAGATSRKKPKVGRNDPCPCGSGRKYKKCCLNKGAA